MASTFRYLGARSLRPAHRAGLPTIGSVVCHGLPRFDADSRLKLSIGFVHSDCCPYRNGPMLPICTNYWALPAPRARKRSRLLISRYAAMDGIGTSMRLILIVLFVCTAAMYSLQNSTTRTVSPMTRPQQTASRRLVAHTK